MTASNLVSVFRSHVERDGNKICLRYLGDGSEESNVLTYRELWEEACNVARFLMTCTDPFDRVVLIDADGYEFTKNFFGCLIAQRIAVPLFPPSGSRHDERIGSILKNCQPKLILAAASLVDLIKQKSTTRLKDSPLAEEITDLMVSCPTDPISKSSPFPTLFGDDCAFIQYSSGSLGEPKGAMVSHGNIAKNLEMIKKAFNSKPESVLVTWLPLFHDMGLIGGPLGAIYSGCEINLMPQSQFIRNPACWWQAVTRYKATITGGPNFSYALSTRKLQSIASEFDLSHLEVTFNGAEPILSSTLEQFSQVFAAAGFNDKSFLPCYGMAEATLFVSSCPWDKKYTCKDGQNQEKKAVNRWVSCGGTNLQEEVTIVDPEKRIILDDGMEGEIWLRGDNIIENYWNNSDASIKMLQARLNSDIENKKYLRTGDLGIKEGDEIYITGRLKDLIIVNGANFYAHDIEDYLCRFPEIGLAAAYPIKKGASEGVGFSVEVKRKYAKQELEPLVNKLMGGIFEFFEIPPLSVYLVKEGQLLRTTSGKIRRGANKEAVENGEIDILTSWVRGVTPKHQIRLHSAPSEKEVSPKQPISNHSLRRNKSELGRVVSRKKKKVKEPTADLFNVVVNFIADYAEIDRNEVDPEADLIRYGFDSVAVLDLCSTIQENTGIEVNQQDLYRLTNIQDLLDLMSEKSA